MKTTKVEWMTQEYAAQRLGLSVRRTMEFAGAGKIRIQRIPDEETHRPCTMLHAGDVEKLAEERERAKTDSHLRALATVDPEQRPQAQQARALLAASESASALPPLAGIPKVDGIPVSENPAYTLDEGACYKRLPASVLLRMIEEGILPALDVGVRQGGRYRVLRHDLDEIRAAIVAKAASASL